MDFKRNANINKKRKLEFFHFLFLTLFLEHGVHGSFVLECDTPLLIVTGRAVLVEHCASKTETETAVLYFHNGNFVREDVERAIKYNIVKNAKIVPASKCVGIVIFQEL